MNKGFTMIEVIISLMITSICVLLLSMMLKIVVNRDYSLYTADDESSIHQMRLLFVLSKDYQINDDMLYFRYLSKDMHFNFTNRKLILEDGYQVFFNHLDNAYFSVRNHCYYFNYQRGNQIKDRVIGCE